MRISSLWTLLLGLVLLAPSALLLKPLISKA